MERILTTHQLTKTFNNTTVVDNINLSVFKGDIYGFLGQNGAGKSTTIRMLLSLISPTKGSVEIFGKNLTSHRNYILSKIGCIVEKPDFYKNLSAYKNLQVFAKLSGISPNNKQIMDILGFVGLQGREKDKVGTYSHGMKQRLGLAQTLIHNPDLIILDEPTTGLDPQGIIEFRNLLLSLAHEQNKTIILSSHILSEIELVANRMVIIHKGKKVVEGVVSELLNLDEMIVSFVAIEDFEIPEALQTEFWKHKCISHNQNALSLQIHREEIPEVNAILINKGIKIVEISSRKKLEDYFLKLTAQA